MNRLRCGCFIWTVSSKPFLFGFSDVLAQSLAKWYLGENSWILCRVRGLQWHLAMRIKLTVVNFKEKDWISVFLLARGAGFGGVRVGFHRATDCNCWTTVWHYAYSSRRADDFLLTFFVRPRPIQTETITGLSFRTLDIYTNCCTGYLAGYY